MLSRDAPNPELRPREYYGPRKLLPVVDQSRYDRHYGKNGERQKGQAKSDESLQPGWSILEPNRIRERRESFGYDLLTEFARAVGVIPYQRLYKIEVGQVPVRESEYELVAKFLQLPIQSLKLPMLTKSETIEWSKIWGPNNKIIEEGGDHDAVILAGFVRHYAEIKSVRKSAICRAAGVPGNAMHYIWHAAKPIDRYSDSTMMACIKLTGRKTWDDVIVASQLAYQEGILTKQIKEVQKPRLRYAPEDPDRKAPWTYEIDPFREYSPRSYQITPFTRSEPAITETKRKKRDKRHNAMRKAIKAYRITRNLIQSILDLEEYESLLLRLFPDDRENALRYAAHPIAAQNLIARYGIIRMVKDGELKNTHGLTNTVNLTRERIRQLAYEPAKMVKDYGVYTSMQKDINLPNWLDYDPRKKGSS